MKAVIFDWDGTLVDSEKVIVYSYKKVLNEMGYDIDADFVLKRIGIGVKKIFIEFFDEKGIPYDEELLKELSDRKNKIHMGLSDKIRTLDGSIELLDSLKGKVKIALASMGNREVIEQIINTKNLGKYFDIVITADDIKEPKPAPDIFLRTASRLGVLPENCLVIEDSVYGVRAAKKANMKCIAVTSGNFSREQLEVESPDLVVKSLRELNYAKIMNLLL